MHRGKISVRNLVEFVLRQGSIDQRRTSSHTAQEGARLHRKLQKEAGEDYQVEVFLKTQYKIENEKIQIEGRADGIFLSDNCWTIDEIKTSAVDFDALEPGQKELFFAQGMVYAYMYATQENLDQMSVQLTYFQTTEERITKEVRSFSIAELNRFLKDLMKEYQRWLVFQDDWRRVRNTSLVQLTFPYEQFRKGQRELAIVAYKTLKNQKILFAEAPTGTGKTISTLFPALKTLGEDSGDRIFYLTAKTITRSVAEDALVALTKQGARVKSVTLTAKDKICFLDERRCNPDDCPFANGYYDRINVALWDLLHHESLMTREVIEKYGRKHQVCPFELSLDVSLFCDLIIADYNYLFDPIVYLRRFFEEESGDSYFLVDEAHNLVSRSREMYSASISDQTFVQLQGLLPKQKRKIQTILAKIISEFDLLKNFSEKEGWIFKHQQAPAETLTNLIFQLSEWLQEYLVEQLEDAN
ncbi:MAG TPA: PD-(D/E)XK nuclease family protein, partial [Enterococcus aquimarinus]|nr:PD-(D/E)XK nuclease family protein [Enterococcus aquimarinus]